MNNVIQATINKVNKALYKLKPITEAQAFNPNTKQIDLKITINNKHLYIEYDTLTKTFYNPLNQTEVNTNELITTLNYNPKDTRKHSIPCRYL